jgi:hypothetical protein
VGLAQTEGEPLWAILRAVEWERSSAEWASDHPEAMCRESRSEAYWQSAEEQWCNRCELEREGLSADWSFYVFGLTPPLVCRLEEFRGSVALPSPSNLSQSHAVLARELTALYGPAETPREVHEFGSAYWRDVLRWEIPELEIYLYRREEPNAAPRLSVLARRRALLDARREDERVNKSKWDYDGDLLRELYRQLVRELAGSFPGLEHTLSLFGSGSLSDVELSQLPEVYETLLGLLQAAENASRLGQPPLLLAADLLARPLGAVPLPERDPPQWNQQRSALAGYGLSYLWNELGASWVYQHELLRRVWNDHPSTVWGEWAFLQLTESGWDTSGYCAEGSDLFREVISQAEQFLKDHPQTPHRVEVLLALAEAYETWWSLSRASPEKEIYADPSQYQDGAETARDQAIAYYEQVLRQAPADAAAAAARRQLPRLRLGIDTNQRRFFCVYD